MALGYWDDALLPRQGWQCPCCKAVFSPDTISCWNCRPVTNVTFTGVTITPVPTMPTPSNPEWELVCDNGGLVLKKKA